jgi:transposase
MTSEKTDTRRRHSAALKAQVVAECEQPGASVAKVAMSHGINANIVHRWRQLTRQEESLVPAKTGEFMALPLAMAAAPATVPATPPADIRVELRRGTTAMTITWPANAAADFALWTRELLR